MIVHPPRSSWLQFRCLPSAIAALVSIVLLAGCGDISLDVCVDRNAEAGLSESEQAQCYEVAIKAIDSENPGERTQAAQLLDVLPTPTPTPTPIPPTTTVGFIEFQYNRTELDPEPGEFISYVVRNVSGAQRLMEEHLWSAKDSNGSTYGPYRTLLRPLVAYGGAQGCWQSSGSKNSYLSPGWSGCAVGFYWALKEPGVHIVEVKYDGKRLPLEISTER